MYKSAIRALALASVFLQINSFATEFPTEDKKSESFATDPLTQGFETPGDASLFQWNATNGNLLVTWDSSKPNSYFRYPLGRIVTEQDNFSVSLDLTLDDIVAGRPDFPGAMQLAFGFQNRAEADSPEFIRGTGADSPNLVEFNYFPDTGFGSTLWPVVVYTNGAANWNGSDDFTGFSLPLGVPMRISLHYTASNRTAGVSVWTNGILAAFADAPLALTNGTFQLDSFAIASYSDAGQDPGYPGAVLAHGVVDNIEIVAPVHPARFAVGRRSGSDWVHEVVTLPGWTYVLEATQDFSGWTEVSEPAAGNGAKITMRAANATTERYRFFRVKALR